MTSVLINPPFPVKLPLTELTMMNEILRNSRHVFASVYTDPSHPWQHLAQTHSTEILRTPTVLGMLWI